jgi:hypothetical protein
MKKGIIHIQLMKMPMLDSSNCQKGSHSGELSHRRKGVIIVQSLTLIIPLGNSLGFIPV